LTPFITSCVRDALGGAAVTSVFDLPADLPPVMLDVCQMQLVISHLTANAVEAMPQGGMLQVVARENSISDESALPLSPGNYVHITFSDTGNGIPPRIFPRSSIHISPPRKWVSTRGRGWV